VVKQTLFIVCVLAALPAQGLEPAELIGQWRGELVFQIADAEHSVPVTVNFRKDHMVSLSAGKTNRHMVAWSVEGATVRIKSAHLPANDVVLVDVEVTQSRLKARVRPTNSKTSFVWLRLERASQ